MKKKLIMTSIFVAIIAVFFAVDYLISLRYQIEFVSLTPNPAYADGETPVKIRVRVTKGGAPVEGHTMSALSLNGGRFDAYRILSDENGEAEFTYFPYLASALVPAQDVTIQVRDESNSVFIAVPAKTLFELPLKMPEAGGDFGTTDSLFGE